MRAKAKRPEAPVLEAAPSVASDPLARAAARFGLKTSGLSNPVRAALSAMQVELERAEAEAEMLRERLADAEALADRDPLIPVLNRRAFLDALQRTTSFVERYGGEAAVLYLDLDDFKQVNDGFGHPAGDAVLKAFGRLLLENVRETDTVGRIGGDEFGIILVQVSKEEARRKAQTLADVIATATCTYEGVEHRVSASIGLHVIARAEAAEAALARADEAMYAVKKNAKKRAKVSS